MLSARRTIAFPPGYLLGSCAAGLMEISAFVNKMLIIDGHTTV